MCVDPSQSWLAVGTDNGMHVCWDLRFRLPVASILHPAGSRVLRLLPHPSQPSCLLSSVQNNNEVSVWDWENQSRTTALWASSAPPLSTTQSSPHNSYGVFVASAVVSANHNKPFVLTGGSDKWIRFWDLTQPENSSLVSAGAYDSVQKKDLSYRFGFPIYGHLLDCCTKLTTWMFSLMTACAWSTVLKSFKKWRRLQHRPPPVPARRRCLRLQQASLTSPRFTTCHR